MEILRPKTGTDKPLFEGDGTWLDFAFPGQNGVPYRGKKIPLMKGEEIDQLEEVWDAHSQLFDISKPEDLSAYNQVCDNAAKGIMFIRVHDLHWSPQTDAPKIFMAWLSRFVEKPNAKFERAVKDDNGQIRFRSH